MYYANNSYLTTPAGFLAPTASYRPAGSPPPPGVDPTAWATMEREDRQASEALRERLGTASAAERAAIISAATSTVLGVIDRATAAASQGRVNDLRDLQSRQDHEIALERLRMERSQQGLGLSVAQTNLEIARLTAQGQPSQPQYAITPAPPSQPPAVQQPAEKPFLETTGGKIAVAGGVVAAIALAVVAYKIATKKDDRR